MYRDSPESAWKRLKAQKLVELIESVKEHVLLSRLQLAPVTKKKSIKFYDRQLENASLSIIVIVSLEAKSRFIAKRRGTSDALRFHYT